MTSNALKKRLKCLSATEQDLISFAEKAFYDGRTINRIDESNRPIFNEPTYQGWLRKNPITSSLKKAQSIKIEMVKIFYPKVGEPTTVEVGFGCLFNIKPKTYEKDGKTFFKIKQWN